MANIQNDQGRTVREHLKHLRMMAPKKTGLHLYRTQAQLKRSARNATLYVLIRSDENTYAIHETLFGKKRAKSPVEWQHFFKTLVLAGEDEDEGSTSKMFGILEGSIIPGVNLKSQKFWTVRAVIGFILHDIHRTPHTAVVARRHKTKSSGRKNGQTNIRRGHRNSKRKTK